jgi:hypothetical protein
MDRDIVSARQKNGQPLWCPVCGTAQSWSKTEADILREKLRAQEAITRDEKENARRARQDAEYFQKSRNAYKGQVTRLKNRAAAGVCPCCNRHFTALERHMKTKHPEFTSEVSE